MGRHVGSSHSPKGRPVTHSSSLHHKERRAPITVMDAIDNSPPFPTNPSTGKSSRKRPPARMSTPPKTFRSEILALVASYAESGGETVTRADPQSPARGRDQLPRAARRRFDRPPGRAVPPRRARVSAVAGIPGVSLRTFDDVTEGRRWSPLGGPTWVLRPAAEMGWQGWQRWQPFLLLFI
jgi:hypothetical protein